MVDNLVVSSDQIASDLERSTPDRLSSHQNQAVALQGQIDLLRSHQVSQDRRINYALAREAEEADGRRNERFDSFGVFLISCLSFLCLPHVDLD